MDNMVETYRIDVAELTRVFEESQKKGVDFRDHDLIVYDYLESKIWKVPELQQMRDIVAQEILLMQQFEKEGGKKSETTH